MKKILLTLSVIAACNDLNARGISVDLAIGTAAPIFNTFSNPVYNGYRNIDYYTSQTSTTASRLNSFGGTMSAGLTLSYMFNRYIGIQTELSLHFPNSRLFGRDSSDEHYTDLHPYDTSYYYQERIVDSWNANWAIFVNPALRFELPGKKLTYCATAGLILPLHVQVTNNGIVSTSTHYYYPNIHYYDNHFYRYGAAYKTKWNPGFTASLGLKTVITERLPNLSFNCVVVLNMLSMQVEEAQLTKYLIDDADKLNTLPADKRSYVPADMSLSFNAISYRLGISYKLSSPKVKQAVTSTQVN